MQRTTVAVVPTEILAATAAVLAGTMCGDPQLMPDAEDNGATIRTCGRHDMFWPDGRAMCQHWSDEYAQLWTLARHVSFGQVDVTGRDGRREGGNPEEQLAAIAGRHADATRGPWFWHGNTSTHEVSLAGHEPGHGVTQVITTMAVARDPEGVEANNYRRYLTGDCDYTAEQADDAAYDWATDGDGGRRSDHRLALMNPGRVLLETIEEAAVYTVARQQGLPDDTPASDPRVYRADICDVRNANGKFLAESWSDVAWLLGHVRHLQGAIDRVEALLAGPGEAVRTADLRTALGEAES